MMTLQPNESVRLLQEHLNHHSVFLVEVKKIRKKKRYATLVFQRYPSFLTSRKDLYYLEFGLKNLLT